MITINESGYENQLTTYTFTDGTQITTKLSADELVTRLNRLNILRVLVEDSDDGEGYKIYNKVINALSKTNNFTGIVRLTINEKDFLSYKLDNSEFLDDEDIEVINYYLKY